MPFQTLIDVGALGDLLGKRRPASSSRGGIPLVIIDCRFDLMNPQAGRLAFAAGHIPGARYADLNRDLSGPITARSGRHPLPAPEALAQRLTGWGVDGQTQVIVYDDANGSFAARLWWLLRWLGHRSVAVLDGGFKAWTAAGGAVEAAPASTAATTHSDANAGRNAAIDKAATAADSTTPTAPFSPHADALAWLSTDQVIAALRNPAMALVDARAPQRYAGAVEPIDPVAGHIPGATNHPFTDNLDADGRFLPAAELRRRWLARLAGKRPVDLVAMCGSGVTACHNLLALEVAGLTGAKLYAGSWSEWVRDPERPVARG
jgi:thiosulfate/3-mercaptopyruvate sulfurtransferase